MENSKALPDSTLCGELKEKQWHQMMLSGSPKFIESLYIAKGLSTAVFKKAQHQMECILASRPTVKPLMKRRGLMSRAAKIPEKPVNYPPPISVEETAGSVSQSSMPVLHQSAQTDTITVYAGINDTPFTQTTAHNSQLGASKIAVSSTPNDFQLSRKESLPESTSLLSIKESILSAILAIPVLTNGNLKTPLLGGSDRPTSLFENIVDPVASSTAGPCQKSPIQSPIAKKSTTPRTKIKVLKDKIEILKSKYGIKECQVTLYNYLKDYSCTKRYGEWDPSKLRLQNEVKKVDRKKDKKKKKLNDNQPKQSLQDSKHKYKRDTPHNSDQPTAKKMRKVDDFDTTVLSTAVPKDRIILRTDSDVPIGISMLEDSTKDDRNNTSSNKENIMTDVERRVGPEVDVRKHIPLPNLAVQVKKGIDIDELSKSHKALVVRVPQTGASGGATNKCSEKDESPNVNETEMDSNNPTKPPSLADIDPAPVCNQSVAHDPAVPSPCSTPALSQDKPAMTMETCQTRTNCLQSGQDISLPTLSVMDLVIVPSMPSPKNKAPISSSLPHDIESSQEPNLKSPTIITALSSKPNGYTSKSKPAPGLKHKLHTPMSEKSPKTSKIDASPPVSKETHNNGADPRRKLFLLAILENNNSTSCVSLEQVTSLPVDNTATAELDLTSVKLHPLLDRHRRTDYSKLKMVQWENSTCYRCNKAFPRHKDWSSHCKTCIL